MPSNLPLVTVVTPTYNSGSTLPATIESVLAQTHSQLEYIIVDGDSTDDTRAIVQPYLSDPRVTFISEPDNGQAHAINKGWRRSNGKLITWLCADDRFLPHTLATGIRVLSNRPEAGWTCGRVRYINREGEPIPFQHRTTPLEYELYRRQEVVIKQPTTLWQRDLLDEFGYLDESLHYALDLEFYLRIGRKYPGHYIDQVLAEATWTRETKTFGGGVSRVREIEQVIRAYGEEQIADSLRVQWTQTHFEESLRQLRRGQPKQGLAALGAAWRFPTHLPKALAKSMLSHTLSERTETQLRRALLR